MHLHPCSYRKVKMLRLSCGCRAVLNERIFFLALPLQNLNSLTMKKIILFLLSFAVVSTSFAQLTLLHTFPSCEYFYTYGDANNLVESLNRYIIRNDNSIQIYKPDFSLEKTVNVNLPSGYVLSGISVSKHLYNTDNSYEIYITATSATAYSNQQYNSQYYCAIIDENGSVLHNFGNAYYASGVFIHIGGQLRFYFIKKMYGETSYITEVYSCSGNYSGIAPTEPSNMLLPYPNPASSIVNLPYEIPQGTTAEMRIFNLDGQLVDVKQIGSHFNNIQLNVDNYTPGLYFYEYNGNKGKFIVQ